MTIFITEIKKDGCKYEGPRINACLWQEAELIAAHIEGVTLTGELA